MSLAAFESFLRFAEGAIRSKEEYPRDLDPVELESALAGYGVVILHSQLEQCLRRAVEIRCSRCTDLDVRAFALSVGKEKTGKVGISWLNQTLNRFSQVCRNSFESDLSTSGLNDSWNSVITNRDLVAHRGQPANLSLADLRLYFKHTCDVMGFFCKGLGLERDEILGISEFITVAGHELV